MKKTPFIVALLPLVLFCAGCGTAEYEKRMASSTSGAASSSKFTSDLAAAETTVPGTTVTLRLPKPMQPADLGDPLHGKFTLFDVPGMKAAYEGFVEDTDHNKIHYYLYVAVIDQPANGYMPGRAWLTELQGKAAKSDDNSAEVNKSYSASTPEGSSTIYEEFHIKCVQNFFYPKPNNPNNAQNIDGNLVCLSRTENGKVVTLIFRYPSYLKGHPSASFDPEWIKLIAGTLKVAAAGG
jgi:hypothetical protein